MRLRVRLTLRRLMLVVSFVALLAWVVVEGERRRARFRELSARYASAEQDRLSSRESVRDGDYPRRKLREIEAYWAKRGPYYAELERKYRRAERYPWLPVWPDPPEPE